jgi:hypothetical protein
MIKALQRLIPVSVAFVILSGCCPPLCRPVPLPPASPLIETVAVPCCPARVVPLNPSGDWDLLPANTLLVRVRAPADSNFQVAIDGTTIQQVSDNGPHPELDSSGFFSVDTKSVFDAADPSVFFVLRVVLPKIKRDSRTPFAINIGNHAPEPATIKVRGYDPTGLDIGMVKPSGVFFSGDNNSDPNSIIAAGVTIAGWVEGPNRHSPGNAPDGETEDWHYDLYLDNDFIERNYGPLGMQLAGLVIPGRPEHGLFDQTTPVPLVLGAVNASSFMMPGEGDFTVELNSWHKPQRGPPPPGWINDPDPSFDKDAWPFAPNRPLGIEVGDTDITSGDYVIISGTLREDPAHLHSPPNFSDSDYPIWVKRSCLDRHYDGQGGWLEVHPTDSIRVIRQKAGLVGPPVIRKHVTNFSTCDTSAEDWLTPVGKQPQNSNLEFREFIDSRFTSSNVTLHGATKCDDGTGPKLHVYAAMPPSASTGAPDKGTFEAVYELWWSATATPEQLPKCVPFGFDAAAIGAGEPSPHCHSTVCNQCVANTCSPGLVECKREGRNTLTCQEQFGNCLESCVRADACPDDGVCCGSIDLLKGTCSGQCVASGGSCPTLCSTGTTCSGICVDLSNDPQNCGACGNKCPSQAACVESSCSSPPKCPNGTHWCAGDDRCELKCANN